MNEIRGRVRSGTINTDTLISFLEWLSDHFKVTTKIVKHIPDDRPIFDRLTAIFPLFSASASGAASAGSGASIGGSRRKYRKTRAKKGKGKKGKSKIESRARRMRNRKTHNAL